MISSVNVVTNRMDESEGTSARSPSHFLLRTVGLSEKQQSPLKLSPSERSHSHTPALIHDRFIRRLLNEVEVVYGAGD